MTLCKPELIVWLKLHTIFRNIYYSTGITQNSKNKTVTIDKENIKIT